MWLVFSLRVLMVNEDLFLGKNYKIKEQAAYPFLP
jgi:hypothetical protein